MNLTEHEMLITIATMALRMDDLDRHDIFEAFRAHGYGSVIAEARKTEHRNPTPRHPMQPIVVDEKGVHRFKENEIVSYMLDEGAKANIFSVNTLAMHGLRTGTKPFSREDHEQLAQLIGYSVSGFCELSYTSDRVCEAALAESDALKK